MAISDQLEVIGPDGQIKFYNLSGGAGVLNIGRDPENDIVIPSPAVAPFHALLDCRQRPYQLVNLSQETASISGQLLLPNATRPLQNWDTIELDGYSLILVEGTGAAPQAASTAPQAVAAAAAMSAVVPVSPVTPTSPTDASIGKTEAPHIASRDELMPEHQDDIIITELSQYDFVTEVQQPSNFQITVTNGGSLVANFGLKVEGLDPDWVTIAPPQVNLTEGQQATINVTITPPRSSASVAGPHHFGVMVYSPEHPQRVSRTHATLHINPYFEFSVGEISPQTQKISWRGREGAAVFAITNRGNSEIPFQLYAEDDERGCQFGFRELGETTNRLDATVRVPSNETREVEMTIRPHKRRFIGMGRKYYPFAVTATPLAGQVQQTPMSVLARVYTTALIGPLLIALMALGILALIVYLLRPTISNFEIDPDDIIAGQPTFLKWSGSPFATLRIDPEIGRLDRSEGEVKITPTYDTVYRLTAENFLTRLAPNLFYAEREVAVLVDPLLPSIRFFVDKDEIIAGEKVTVSWELGRAERAILFANEAPQTISPSHFTGSSEYILDQDTTFTMRVFNPYTPEEGIQATIKVRVVVPEPTPLPPPVIERFDVSPLRIVSGEIVNLSWEVSGAETVEINPLGPFPGSGALDQAPTDSVAYVLVARNGDAEVQLLRQVIVDPAPTPTPLPGTPVIEFFTATPNEVVLGSAEADNVLLSWSVTGDTTNITLSAIGFGSAVGLSPQGTQTVSVNQRTLYILTAENQGLTTSATVEVKVINPVPVINNISPQAGTNLEGDAFILLINGSNFLPSSVVRWDGADRPTTYISDTQLSTLVLADDLLKAGSYTITVFNPTPGGGDSNPVTYDLSAPVPVINQVSPAKSYKTRTTAFSLIITGTGFLSTSRIELGGVDVPATFLSSTQLTAVITPEVLTSLWDSNATATDTAINVNVQVISDAIGSNTQPFEITLEIPKPLITSISPAYAVENTGPVVVTLYGENFIADYSVLNIKFSDNTQIYPTPTVNADGTELTFTLTNTHLANFGVYTITVENPPASPGGIDGGISNSQTFAVLSEVNNLTPSCTTAGVDAIELLIDYDGTSPFELSPLSANQTQVLWSYNSNVTELTPLPSSTAQQLRISIPASMLSTPGLVSIEMTGAGALAPQSFFIYEPLLKITETTGPPYADAATPQTLLVGDSTSVRVVLSPSADCTYKANQSGNRTVDLDITGGVGSFTYSPSFLTLDLTPEAGPSTDTSGTLTVTAKSLTTGDPANISASYEYDTIIPVVTVTSLNTVDVSAVNPQPVLTSLSQTIAPASNGSFILTLYGSDFMPGAKVLWANGTTLDTANPDTLYTPTYIDTNTLSVQILDADDNAGYKRIAVQNPGPCVGGVCVSTIRSFTFTGLTLTANTTTIDTGEAATFTVGIVPTPSTTQSIALSTSSGLATLSSSSVSIPGGSSSTTFTATGGSSSGSVNVTATWGGNTQTVALSVNQLTHSLTVNLSSAPAKANTNSVVGTGTFASGSSISCTDPDADGVESGVCTNNYLNNTDSQLLTVTPDSAHTFTGWTVTPAGSTTPVYVRDCSSLTICQIKNMTDSYTITANFVVATRILTIDRSGGLNTFIVTGTDGTTDVTCGSNCPQTGGYYHDTNITVSLSGYTPGDWVHYGWIVSPSANIVGTSCRSIDTDGVVDSTCNVTMNGDTSVTPVFKAKLTIYRNSSSLTDGGSNTCTSGTSCDWYYDYNASVTVSITTPASGHWFDYWTVAGSVTEVSCPDGVSTSAGDTNTNTTCQITMSGSGSVTANYGHRIDFYPSPNVSITSITNVTNCTGVIAANAHCYDIIPDIGTTMTVTASPQTNYEINTWGSTNLNETSGCVDATTTLGGGTTCTVELNASADATLNVVSRVERFTVTIPTGGNTTGYSISSSTSPTASTPASIACSTGNGSDCVIAVDYNNTVTLTVAGSNYAQWGDDCSGSGIGNQCVISNVTADKTVSATPAYKITINNNSGQTIFNDYGAPNCTGTVCYIGVPPSTSVNLTTGSAIEWSGDCTSVSTSCALSSIAANKTVTAATLVTITINNTSGQTISNDYDVSTCSSSCTLNVPSGTTVVFSTGSAVAWGGDCTVALTTSCTLTSVTTAKTVNATPSVTVTLVNNSGNTLFTDLGANCANGATCNYVVLPNVSAWVSAGGLSKTWVSSSPACDEGASPLLDILCSFTDIGTANFTITVYPVITITLDNNTAASKKEDITNSADSNTCKDGDTGCTIVIARNTSVTLTATGNVTWSGGTGSWTCSGVSSSCTLSNVTSDLTGANKIVANDRP